MLKSYIYFTFSSENPIIQLTLFYFLYGYAALKIFF